LKFKEENSKEKEKARKKDKTELISWFIRPFHKPTDEDLYKKRKNLKKTEAVITSNNFMIFFGRPTFDPEA